MIDVEISFKTIEAVREAATVARDKMHLRSQQDKRHEYAAAASLASQAFDDFRIELQAILDFIGQREPLSRGTELLVSETAIPVDANRPPQTESQPSEVAGGASDPAPSPRDRPRGPRKVRRRPTRR
jgi:hypothetical protein